MKLTLEKAKALMDQNNGGLDLSYTGITELPDNLTVGGDLYLSGTGVTELPDNLTVGGGLYLSGTGITALPDNLTVGGNLDLSYTEITELPDNLTVGGWLDLSDTGITELPDNLTVGGGLDLSDTEITELPDNLTVGGWLDLSDTEITELPDNLTVGGWLDLSDTGITELPDNLTVGGDLDLRYTGITALPDNLTVGGSLYLSGTKITNPTVKKLCQGDYVPGKYLYADRILTHIKKKRKIGEYTLFVGKIPGHNVVFDGKHYAHCKNFRDGVGDLLFKSAADRGADQYRGISLDDSFAEEELETMYRVITGACQQGTRAFIDGLKERKERYTIRETIELTKGQYGAERFQAFFEGGA